MGQRSRTAEAGDRAHSPCITVLLLQVLDKWLSLASLFMILLCPDVPVTEQTAHEHGSTSHEVNNQLNAPVTLPELRLQPADAFPSRCFLLLQVIQMVHH